MENLKHFKEQKGQPLTNEMIDEIKIKNYGKYIDEAAKYSFDGTEMKVGDFVFYALIKEGDDDSRTFKLISLPEEKLDDVIVVESKLINNRNSILPIVKLK